MEIGKVDDFGQYMSEFDPQPDTEKSKGNGLFLKLIFIIVNYDAHFCHPFVASEYAQNRNKSQFLVSEI